VRSPEAARLARKSRAAFEEDDVTRAVALAADSGRAVAHTYLQILVGLIAITLPFVVAIGNLLLSDDGDMPGSISAYYYTPMRNWFVGALCALAVFFLSYQYKPLPQFERDHRLSQYASAAAVGVAFFPTADEVRTAEGQEKVISTLHLMCACALFLLLTYFALFLFTKTGGEMTTRKRQRNLVYTVCGVVMAVAIACVILSNIVKPPGSWNTLFWLESVCVVAFGVSWLVKGGFLGVLADEVPGAAGG
jgi:hypothetical protein